MTKSHFSVILPAPRLPDAVFTTCSYLGVPVAPHSPPKNFDDAVRMASFDDTFSYPPVPGIFILEDMSGLELILREEAIPDYPGYPHQTLKDHWEEAMAAEKGRKASTDTSKGMDGPAKHADTAPATPTPPPRVVHDRAKGTVTETRPDGTRMITSANAMDDDGYGLYV